MKYVVWGLPMVIILMPTKHGWWQSKNTLAKQKRFSRTLMWTSQVKEDPVWEHPWEMRTTSSILFRKKLMVGYVTSGDSAKSEMKRQKREPENKTANALWSVLPESGPWTRREPLVGWLPFHWKNLATHCTKVHSGMQLPWSMAGLPRIPLFTVHAAYHFRFRMSYPAPKCISNAKTQWSEGLHCEVDDWDLSWCVHRATSSTTDWGITSDGARLDCSQRLLGW